jgi:hypothetical protein
MTLSGRAIYDGSFGAVANSVTSPYFRISDSITPDHKANNTEQIPSLGLKTTNLIKLTFV